MSRDSERYFCLIFRCVRVPFRALARTPGLFLQKSTVTVRAACSPAGVL
jgi:hypothetical protein